MLDVVKKNHLSGHVISIPICQHNNQSQEVQLPRLEYSDHIKLAFFGKRGMKKIAFDLMRKQDFDFIVVRLDVLETWMAALEMNKELRRFQDQRDEYIKAWKEEESKIRAAAIDSDDKTACDIRRRSCADVAKARLQFDPDDDVAYNNRGNSYRILSHYAKADADEAKAQSLKTRSVQH